MAAGLGSTPALAGDAVPLDLSYDLSLGGLTVMTFDLNVKTTGDRYVLDFAARTRGMLSLFGSGYIVSSTQGHVLPDGTPVPEAFATHSDGNEGERRAQIQYGPDGPASWVADPKPGSDGKQVSPVPPGSIPGSKDILTALLDFSEALNRDEGCARQLKVFDGRHRFDLTFSDRGQETFTPEGVGFYAGPAQHCHIDLTRLGGYPAEPDKYLSADDAEVWLAQVLPGEPPVPVEIVFKGKLGMMHARLAVARHGTTVRGAPEQTPQSAAVSTNVDNPR